MSSYKFYTDFSKKIDIEKANLLNSQLNREENINKLYKVINNKKISKELEESIFEFTLIYSHINFYDDNLIYAVYNDKFNDIIQNLDSKYLGNKNLLKNIKSKKINHIDLPYLKPNELFPENWQEYKTKQDIQKSKIDNMAYTTMYKCYKCGERKCKVTQMQTRSADEPMTTFVYCLVCGSSFKK